MVWKYFEGTIKVSTEEDSMPLEGAIAPPMANGELIFELPWQGRVFGMARSLCDQGVYEWDEFRENLIDEIAYWDANHSYR